MSDPKQQGPKKPKDEQGNKPQGEGSNNNRPPQNNMMSRGMMPWFLFGGLALLLLYLFTNASNQVEQITEIDFLTYSKNGDFIEPVIVEDERIIALDMKHRCFWPRFNFQVEKGDVENVSIELT